MPGDLHSEIHILHQAVGTRPPSAYSDDDGRGHAYLTVVRRAPHERPLTVHDVTDATRHWRPSLFCNWKLSHLHIEESTHPQSVKVTFTFAPDEDLRWKQHSGYFARYHVDADAITKVLPTSWGWFIDRLHALSAREASALSSRRRARQTAADRKAADDYTKLVALIEEEVTADKAIWGTSERYAVETLARKLGLPRRTFERRMARARDGRSAAATIQEIRLELAYHLLPKYSTVKEMANRVGYDRSHFAKLFQERYGIHPSDRTR